jgi:hypothetical protein
MTFPGEVNSNDAQTVSPTALRPPNAPPPTNPEDQALRNLRQHDDLAPGKVRREAPHPMLDLARSVACPFSLLRRKTRSYPRGLFAFQPKSAAPPNARSANVLGSGIWLAAAPTRLPDTKPLKTPQL